MGERPKKGGKCIFKTLSFLKTHALTKWYYLSKDYEHTGMEHAKPWAIVPTNIETGHQIQSCCLCSHT